MATSMRKRLSVKSYGKIILGLTTLIMFGSLMVTTQQNYMHFLSPRAVNSDIGVSIMNVSAKLPHLLALPYAEDPTKSPYQDIMNMKPIRFLPNYKNPCWRGEDGLINDGEVHCLPYFYVIGNKKCGTSDLYFNIMQHPDVINPGFKEAQWFPRLRFSAEIRKSKNPTRPHTKNLEIHKLEYYIRLFQWAANQIAATKLHSSSTTINHIHITGEGSPSNLYLPGEWELLPGNEGLQEPKYTNLHYIRHLVPQTKIIVIYRNPVDRLFSDFRHTNRIQKLLDNSPERFHTVTKQAIDMYANCFQHSTMRSCIYNNTLLSQVMQSFSFTTGFYAFFMKELLDVFPKDQILPLLFDDYTKHPVETVSRTYDFLQLSKLDRKVIEQISQHQPKNSGRKKYKPMLPETRTMLELFYRPFNEEMSQLMNDSRYLFDPIIVDREFSRDDK